MAEARRDHDWRVAAEAMAVAANCHRDPKEKPFTAADFHLPTLERQAARMQEEKVGVDILKTVFVDRHRRKGQPQ